MILSVLGDVSVNIGVMVSELFCLFGRFGVELVVNLCLFIYLVEIWVVCLGVVVWLCYWFGGGNCFYLVVKYWLFYWRIFIGEG